MSRVRWWLLAEDPPHERLARALAAQLKLGTHVKSHIAPRGLGDPKAWIWAQLPDVVQQTVRRRPDERVCLMVVIDGDNVGAVARLRQTEKCIQPPRTDDEPVVILVPTWSTETWLLPADETADETTSSKHRIRVLTREMFTLAAKRVINGPDPDRLPAINLARVELRRIAL